MVPLDGFSRRILWLHVTHLNNSPDNIANFYLGMVKELMGCPVELVTDLGTENAIVAAARAIFKITQILIDMLLLHVTEGWWSFFARTEQTGGEH